MNGTVLVSNRRIDILLIIAVSLLVYLAALGGGVSSLDDAGLFQALQQGDIQVSSQFLSGGGTYYRPLSALSYLNDFIVWGANPVAFHVTNLALHTLNALLVYLLARNSLEHSDFSPAVALLAALFFVVHPLTCEAVAWISGRTDLLCGLFFLMGLVILTSESLGTTLSCALLFPVFFCSLLAKESAMALLVIAPLGLCAARTPVRGARVAATIATLLAAALAYGALRWGSARQLDQGLSVVAGTLAGKPPGPTLHDTVAVAGFYLGKLIWPYPLNIAIQEFDRPLFLVAGCLVSAVALPLFMRCREARLPLAIMFFGLIPPLLAFHAGIPWMPLAERYLYLPLTGAALLFALGVRHGGRIAGVVSLPVIVALAFTTNARATLWADPVAFWGDTVALSPHVPAARVIFAYELLKTGRMDTAAAELDTVSRQGYEDSLYWKCRMLQYLAANDPGGYESAMVGSARLSGNPSALYAELAMTLSRQTTGHADQQRLFMKKAIGYYEKSWQLDHRAVDGLYRAARLSLRIGDREGCRRLLSIYLRGPEAVTHGGSARELLHAVSSGNSSRLAN
jgi:hypothetical protein